MSSFVCAELCSLALFEVIGTTSHSAASSAAAHACLMPPRRDFRVSQVAALPQAPSSLY